MQASRRSTRTAARPGLRERKKQATRLAISDVATRLFIAHGFDRVTLADVAAKADVSVNTILNYFSTKEDLFFDRAPEVEEALARVIRERAVDEPVLDALERGVLAALEAAALILPVRSIAFVRTIESSPALRARERLIHDESERHLAAALHEALHLPPNDVTPRLVAAALMGMLVRLTMDHRAHLLSRGDDPALRKRARASVRRMFALLREGFVRA